LVLDSAFSKTTRLMFDLLFVNLKLTGKYLFRQRTLKKCKILKH